MKQFIVLCAVFALVVLAMPRGGTQSARAYAPIDGHGTPQNPAIPLVGPAIGRANRTLTDTPPR